MNSRSVSFLRDYRRALIGFIAGSTAFTAAGFALAQSAEGPLYSFKGGTDGGLPEAGLIFDSKGALYGTTAAGGPVAKAWCSSLRRRPPGRL